MAFGGTPSIVNPTLAGTSKRKTDVLDAQMLATHDLVGVWRESYIPSPDISELWGLIWERDHCLIESTAASRQRQDALKAANEQVKVPDTMPIEYRNNLSLLDWLNKYCK